jgi:two-component system chemotaxis response regulator CheB
MYFKKAKDAERRVDIVRQAVQQHEQLSADSIQQQANSR